MKIMAHARCTDADRTAWLTRFRAAGAGTSRPDMLTIKACRREIWEQTKAYVQSQQHGELCGRHFFAQKVTCPDSLANVRGTWRAHVLNQDILDVAWTLCKQGKKVAVLNMASDTKAGGGVADGAGAQEENLYRRTDMCSSMESNQRRLYPLKGQALLSYPVMLLRGREDDGYPFLTPPVPISVISCAAVRRPWLDDCGGYDSWKIQRKMQSSIRNILEAAVRSRCDVLLLSAFGCGAYKNPPHEVAKIFKQELSNRNLCQVIFCIRDDHNAGRGHNPNGNYAVFQDFFPCCKMSWHGWHCHICGAQW